MTGSPGRWASPSPLLTVERVEAPSWGCTREGEDRASDGRSDSEVRGKSLLVCV